MDKSMRELKFRAWDKHRSMMIYKPVLDYDDGFWQLMRREDRTCPDIPDDITLMQYTGIKDKNGNEIYEGDILTYNNPEYKLGHETPYVIKWSVVEAGFVCVNKTNFMLPIVWKDMEIIGNVAENPELIE